MTNVYNRKLSALTIKVPAALKYSATLLPIDFLFEKFVPVQKLTTFAINFDANTATHFLSRVQVVCGLVQSDVTYQQRKSYLGYFKSKNSFVFVER